MNKKRSLDRASSGLKLFGARFTYTFVMREALPQKIATTAPSSSLEGLQILLAEDDVLIGTLTQKQLEAAGAQVIWAKNGKEALEPF